MPSRTSLTVATLAVVMIATPSLACNSYMTASGNKFLTFTGNGYTVISSDEGSKRFLDLAVTAGSNLRALLSEEDGSDGYAYQEKGQNIELGMANEDLTAIEDPEVYSPTCR